MIKNIKDLKKIQIVCRRKEEIEDCFNMLEELGFEVRNNDNQYQVIFYREHSDMFENDVRLQCGVVTYFYNKDFIKNLQKLIKEKEKQEKVKDFEVAEDGRIIKVNNWMSEKQIFLLFIRDKAAGTINRFSQDCLIKYVNLGFVYATEQARDKAIFKLEIETKLKNIAERLNEGRKIDWEDGVQEKFHIYYNYDKKILEWYIRFFNNVQGAIFCLDQNFLDVAKQEIGEQNLIKYFKD